MKKEYLFLGLAVTLLIIILFSNYWFLLDKDPIDQSAFGSMFGVSSALFSGLAFLGLIYTIFLQMKELSLQRDELKLTREELHKSAEAHQNALNYQQQQAKSLERAAIINGYSVLLDALKERDKMCDFYKSKSENYKFDKAVIHNQIADLTKKLEAFIK
ncbi:hypothetical protein [Vibrio metschnikovii]|uniref:Uncharacterized protein n=1 Tax=Vibrio metschnikovii TaxID=28172 RepID=A0A9X0RBS8_VIBME|nr:hypothetical protein [Vibrio metschnikovii]MBC5853499.1 hypothetical protein [Vibrio metschnikovii]